MQPLEIIVHELRGIRYDIAELCDTPMHSDAGYFRVCNPRERVIDILDEAKKHGSIAATKGLATVIMPKLVDGWEPIRGVRRRA